MATEISKDKLQSGQIVPIGQAGGESPQQQFTPVKGVPGLSISLDPFDPGSGTEGAMGHAEPRGFGPVGQFGQGSNIGISEALGGPVDLANALFGAFGLEIEEPFGGSRSIRRAFHALGLAPPPDQDTPDTIYGSVGRTVGLTAAAGVLPGGLAARPAARALTTGLTAPTTTTRGVVQQIGQEVLTRPGTSAAIETGLGATAGGGGFVARNMFPDSDAASFIGEMVGGFTPAAVVSGARFVPSVLTIRVLRKQFTPHGARRRAERRLQQVTRRPGPAAAEFRAPTTLPEAGLTPFQLAGDEGLLSLERTIIESSEALIGRFDEQISNTVNVIRQSLTDLGEGASPEITKKTLSDARQYITHLAETRLRIAALQADERIADLSPQAGRQAANKIARQELDDALSDIRTQEKEIWAIVPDEFFVPTDTSKAKFAELWKGLSTSQREDMPAIAVKKLHPETGAFGEQDSVLEVQGLRSKLLEIGRIASSEEKFNRARLAYDLAESLLDDLGAPRGGVPDTDAGEALRAALDFSRDLNERFTRGPVANLLGASRRGGPGVAPELTLEASISQTGPAAQVEFQAMGKALEGTDRFPRLRGAVRDIIVDNFLNSAAVRDGQINRVAAERFLANNRFLLDELPETKKQITDAIEAGEIALLRRRRAEGLAKRLNDPKVSRAAVFIQEPVEQAMARIAKSPRPDLVMRETIKQAQRDKSGQAVKGLKTAYGDALLKQALTTRTTIEGEFVPSGTRIQNLLKDGPWAKMAAELFSKEELSRLDIIANTAVRVEQAMQAKARPEGIIADLPSKLAKIIAGIGGAQLGRIVAGQLGGGTVQTPGMVANEFRNRLLRATQEPAERLLIDSISDEKLFKSLLLGNTPEETKAFRKQLNLWLVGIGTGGVITEEPKKRGGPRVLDQLPTGSRIEPLGSVAPQSLQPRPPPGPQPGTAPAQPPATNIPETILRPQSKGEGIVDDSISVVESLFPGGGDFLKRIARAESNFGQARDTFRESGDKGIFQIREVGFEATKDTASHPNLQRAHDRIRDELGIDWQSVEFSDLDKPLIAALAARLFLLRIPEPIPETLEGQAEYWKKFYNTALGKGTVEGFIKKNS